jgi:hypothetical protein
MASNWWDGMVEERFWLESTDREDIGTDLRAPLTDANDQVNWRYDLFRFAKPGDTVFHYDKRSSAIVSMSRISGEAFEAPIIWAARGSYARERGAVPTEVPGYRIPLDDHRALAKPLGLEAIRNARARIGEIYDAIPSTGARYFPFELSDRPIRPLQGYAFKLPSSFVDAFAELHSATVPVASADQRSEAEIFRDALANIEASAAEYAIAGLQALRARNRGLQRIGRSIFGNRQLADDWAFHRGGRDELQFNVGLDFFPDGARAFRTGVAFSFEPSRSLPSIDVLVPKVARFNAYLRENPEAFADLAMWHWQDDVRSQDYAPGPIPEKLIRHGTFVFLGDRFPILAVDPHASLRTLDRLLPLYEWVERSDVVAVRAREPGAPIEDRLDTLRLDGGRVIDGGRWIKATSRARTLDIFLRHWEIQRRLKDQLSAEGASNVILEAPIGERAIDAVAHHGTELWFYEVKTAPTVRGCLREAIGQLLEYSLWPGATRPHRLVVVGEPALDPHAQTYIDALNESFPIPISYRQLALG